MTFDDGIVKIYQITQTAATGKMPIEGITYQESFYFGYDTVGIQRYYTALQANQQIEAVINIPGWSELNPAQHVAVLENGKQYRIRMVQPMTDEDGLRITKLTLERMHESHDVMPRTN